MEGPARESDVDRGPLVGVALGAGMFFLFQGFILAAFQSPVISGETALLAPLRFAGISQAIYVFPSVLFFINRKCPRMAYGFLGVAGVVLVGTLIALVAG